MAYEISFGFKVYDVPHILNDFVEPSKICHKVKRILFLPLPSIITRILLQVQPP